MRLCSCSTAFSHSAREYNNNKKIPPVFFFLYLLLVLLGHLVNSLNNKTKHLFREQMCCRLYINNVNRPFWVALGEITLSLCSTYLLIVRKRPSTSAPPPTADFRLYSASYRGKQPGCCPTDNDSSARYCTQIYARIKRGNLRCRSLLYMPSSG